MPEITEALVLCAGRGTRMGDLTEDRPKPMIEFGGVPFLQFVITHLKKQGITRLVIPLGYMGDTIPNYFGDGSNFGIEIEYVESSVEAETGGSFMRAAAVAKTDIFMMQYGDGYIPIDYRPAFEQFLASDKLAMVFCNQKPPKEQHKNNITVDENNMIVGYGKKEGAQLHDAGVMVCRKEVLNFLEGDEFKISSRLFPIFAEKGQLMAYVNPKMSMGIGAPEKVERFNKYLETNTLLDEVKAIKKE